MQYSPVLVQETYIDILNVAQVLFYHINYNTIFHDETKKLYI